MEDRTRTGSTFIDEEIDFDTLLEEDEPKDTASRGFLKPRKRDAYRPARLGRTAPNWSRIAVALFVLAVMLFVVGFGIKSYLDHRTTSAYRAYFTGVSSISSGSDTQGKTLQNLLAQPSGSDRAQLVGRLEKLTKAADKTIGEARALTPPDQLASAHESFILALEYRRNGLANLRRAMTSALAAKDQRTAAIAIVEANQRLEASDVIFVDSYSQVARNVLAAEGITGVQVSESDFVSDMEFTSLKATILMLDRLTTGMPTTGTKAKEQGKACANKVCGGQLTEVSVSPSGQTLALASTTEVAGSDDLAFEVSFENQGEVQIAQLPVIITIKGESSEPQEIKAFIEKVDPGQVGSVRVPLDKIPTFGETLTVTVKAGPVPGELKVENNSATYSVLFRL